MMRDNVVEYLSGKRLPYKLVGSGSDEQVLLAKCPFCFDTGGTHFYIALDTGQFYCHKCGKGGSFLTFKKQLGDVATIAEPFVDMPTQSNIHAQHYPYVVEAHHALLQDKAALLYLSERRFSAEAIHYFRLGLYARNEGQYLGFPYLVRGELKDIKYRSLPPEPKKFRRLGGGESILYNEDAINGDKTAIIVCEGESDAIAVWSHGFKNVVGVTVGAQGIKNEWIDKLDPFRKIYLLFDNDDAGSAGAQKLANRLGIERCYQVLLPIGCKDINEFFIKGYTKAHFKEMIEAASKFDVEYVKSLGGLITSAIRQDTAGANETRLELPWNNLNKLLNGFVAGDLIVVAGKPGVGKSTFCFNMLYYWARMDIPVLLFTLEMPPWRILPRLIALHKRIDSRYCGSIEALSSTIKELSNMPLYMAYKYDRPAWNFVADTVRHCVKRYGIQFMVFDNLHFLCRSLTKQTEEVSVNIQNFKLLAEELAIPIVVIARPRKTNAKVISGEDLKDSADIEGDSDIILIISRERKKTIMGGDVEGNFEAQTLIVVDKCRFSAGGATYLQASDPEARFDSIGG